MSLIITVLGNKQRLLCLRFCINTFKTLTFWESDSSNILLIRVFPQERAHPQTSTIRILLISGGGQKEQELYFTPVRWGQKERGGRGGRSGRRRGERGDWRHILWCFQIQTTRQNGQSEQQMCNIFITVFLLHINNRCVQTNTFWRSHFLKGAIFHFKESFRSSP